MFVDCFLHMADDNRDREGTRSILNNQDGRQPLARSCLKISLKSNADIHCPAAHKSTHIIKGTALQHRQANPGLSRKRRNKSLTGSCPNNVQEPDMQAKLRSGGTCENGGKDDEDERRKGKSHQQG